MDTAQLKCTAILTEVVALCFGGCYVGAAWRFARREDRARARMLLFISILYLPAMYAAMFIDPTVLRSFQG